MINYIKRIVRFLILKYKWRGKLKFSFSDNISLKSSFEGMNKIHPNTEFNGELGFGSYIASNSRINGKIGKFTSIGPYVRCNEGTHPYKKPFVTTAPCFFSVDQYPFQNGGTFAKEQCFNEFKYIDDQKKYAIRIGNDCWIGEGVFLIGGIEISDGAVVLGHAVVTKDVPAYAIVGGVPAKVIAYRYSEEDINIIKKSGWWDNSTDWFKMNWQLLTDIDLFKKFIND